MASGVGVGWLVVMSLKFHTIKKAGRRKKEPEQFEQKRLGWKCSLKLEWGLAVENNLYKGRPE